MPKPKGVKSAHWFSVGDEKNQRSSPPSSLLPLLAFLPFLLPSFPFFFFHPSILPSFLALLVLKGQMLNRKLQCLNKELNFKNTNTKCFLV